MIRVVICDDDPEISAYLARLVERAWREPHTLHLCTKAVELETYLIDDVQGDVDLLLLDIDLGGRNGIDLSAQILKQYPHIKIIFLTGYIDFSRDIFRSVPAGFLVKPVDELHLLAALNSAVQQLRLEETRCLTIQTRDGVLRLPYRDIRYFESEAHVVRIHAGAVNEIYQTLNRLEPLLPSEFLRCHQSYLVNLRYVSRFRGSSFLLTDGTELPVSKMRQKKVREAFFRYVGNCI